MFPVPTARCATHRKVWAWLWASRECDGKTPKLLEAVSDGPGTLKPKHVSTQHIFHVLKFSISKKCIEREAELLTSRFKTSRCLTRRFAWLFFFESIFAVVQQCFFFGPVHHFFQTSHTGTEVALDIKVSRRFTTSPHFDSQMLSTCTSDASLGGWLRGTVGAAIIGLLVRGLSWTTQHAD